MLGANYLGSTYLGQGWSGVVSLPASSPVASWVYATPTTTLQSDEVTQFLTLHGVDVICQGDIVASVLDNLVTWETLGDVAQSFVAPAAISWLRIPITSDNLLPTTEPGWPDVSSMTVALYSDVGGVPGALLSSALVPVAQLEAVQTSTWPEPQDALFGVPVIDSQASLPQLLGTGWTGITTLIAGSWGILLATNGGNPTQLWVVPYNGSDLGAWIIGTTLPINDVTNITYAPTVQVLAACHGDVVWTTTFSQFGVVGSWQQQPILPDSIQLLGTLTVDSIDYLVAVTTNGQSWFGQLSPSGSVGSWVLGEPYPVPFTSGNSYSTATGLLFVTEEFGSLTLVTVASPQGGWVISGTIAATNVVGLIGNSVITLTNGQLSATALSASGVAPWSLPIALGVSDVALLPFSLGEMYQAFWIPTSGGSGYNQAVYTTTWVTVPLSQTLTAGSTYHLVISATNTLTSGVAVPVTNGAGGQVFDVDWQPLNGAIPFLAFAGAGLPLAFIGSGKTTIVWFDTPSGEVTTLVEIMGTNCSCRTVSYSNGVLSEVT